MNYIYIIIYYIYETFNYHRLKCLFCRFVDLTRGGGGSGAVSWFERLVWFSWRVEKHQPWNDRWKCWLKHRGWPARWACQGGCWVRLGGWLIWWTSEKSFTLTRITSIFWGVSGICCEADSWSVKSAGENCRLSPASALLEAFFDGLYRAEVGLGWLFESDVASELWPTKL